MKYLRASVIPVLVSLIFANQTWISIRLVASKTLEISGTEAAPLIAPVVVVSALAVLLSLYLKKRSSLPLLFLAAVGLGVSGFSALIFQINQDASAGANSVAKATGIQGWASQTDSVVETWSITANPVFCFACVLVSLVLVVTAIVKLLHSEKDAKEGVRRKNISRTDLWSETSN